jgi:predicted nucleotide-binding protein
MGQLTSTKLSSTPTKASIARSAQLSENPEAPPPSVFIGSSSAALDLARRLKAALGDAVRAEIWDENAIKTNPDGSYTDGAVMANLFQTARLYDYAIMILRPDDTLKTVDEKGQPIDLSIPRDNVIFELGLFMGAIGGRRALAVVSHGATAVRLPSDLFGFDQVTLAGEDEASVQAAAPLILGKIMDSYNSVGLSLLPSTGLAIGYFNNFVRPVCRYLEGGKVSLDDEEMDISETGYVFDVVIPSSLATVGTDASAAFRKRQGDSVVLRKVSLNARDYPFMVRVDSLTSTLRIVDYITPLSASVAAISLVAADELTLSPAKDVGGPERIEKAKALMCEREIANFRNTLAKLLEREAQNATDEPSRRFPARVRLISDET